MGACFGKKQPKQPGQWQDAEDENYARRLQQQEIELAQGRGGRGGNRKGGRGGSQPLGNGQVLGSAGGAPGSPQSAEERRRLQLQAAEARARQSAGRGGVSEKRAKELEEQQVKEDLIGKIQAYCAMRKKDEPLGLRLATVDQLRDTLRQLQTGV
ncbi:unnamed protein product [Amoebophrya sp. A25]|nr:unnamed protein product [Amoebophrya sp. A25]|eukprot:GSA25T00005856001.1